MSDPVPVDAALVHRLVAGQFPRWADLSVRPVDVSGVDNATFRLGADMLVRLPRFERWVGQVAREQKWLPLLAPHLPLPVPEPLAVGTPDEGFPFPWSVYRWIDGEPARIERMDRPQAAADLAGFLTALRRIDQEDGPPPEWSNGFRGCAMSDERDSPVVASRVLPRIAALDGLVDTDAVLAVWEAALAAPEWDGPPVWVHGDPAPNNLLMSGGRLCAVIDFGTLAVGDPACDLGSAWTFLSEDARDAFRDAVGLDDATWVRGRGWGLAATLPTPEELTDPAGAADARRRIAALVEDHQRIRVV